MYNDKFSTFNITLSVLVVIKAFRVHFCYVINEKNRICILSLVAIAKSTTPKNVDLLSKS